MKILITGASGFIGSHAVEILSELGNEVIALDITFNRVKQGKIKTKKLSNVQFHKVDISKRTDLKPSYFRNVDWIFHFAGKSNIVPSIEHPLDYHDVNVTGTINLLEMARKYYVKKFVYAASSSCYGIPNVYPTLESAEIKPEYPYALTKYLGEQYVMHWGKVYKLPVISLRLFNVYGPRVRTYGTYGPVISIFAAQKLANKPFTVVGDGTQTRDFTFVTDIVNAFITAAKSNITQEVFNVGSGGTYSINRMVELLGGPVIYIPKRPGEPDCTYADISKIQKILKWKPKISFEEGIRIVLKNIDYWENSTVWTPRTIKKATKTWFKYLGNNR
jgi:UDP-glucose 4-epimerase